MNRIKHAVTSAKTTELIDITPAVEQALEKEKIQQGEVSLFLLHSTAALTASAFNPAQDLDLLATIETILPNSHALLHAHSHLPLYVVASFLGQHLSIPVENGKLLLGDMQRIILVELNGPRERTVVMDCRS